METKKIPSWMLPLFLLCFSLESQLSIAADTISFKQSLSGNGTIVSKGGVFELGFFKPGNSSNYYIGIWYKKASQPNTVWVANREKPVRDINSSVLKIYDGNLVLFNESQIPIWSTNVTSSTNSTSVVAVLLDDGNLVLRDGPNSSTILWQSFDHPADTWLPGMKLSFDKRTNQSRCFTSWRNQDDPATGFQPVSLGEWEQQLYSGGCVRQAKLQCENASVDNGREDQFLKIHTTTLPTYPQNVAAHGNKECKSTCLKNCSCSAYAYNDNECSIWIGDLLNMKQLGDDDDVKTLHIRLAYSEFSSPTKKKKLIIVAVAVSSGLFLLGLSMFIIKRRWMRTIIATNPREGTAFFPATVALQVTEGGDALNLLDSRLNGNVKVEELSRICTVACWCIQDDEFQRPTMSQVVQILEGVLEVSQPPIPRLLQACIKEHLG
ncbi:hypothetical protein COLO4_13065 [Corchorus olitorius]|uniref:S-locus glycoprotein n=1 Tax=Corchorus olitorius TaxID=93759 RepID=A0A1R3JYF5_9ROSI|nr:hypothetical protein COLO4_13065 [Corchorus olitorius]